MTITATVHYREDGKSFVKEQPSMEKPLHDDPKYIDARNSYNMDMCRYDDHLASLRQFPYPTCTASEDGRVGEFRLQHQVNTATDPVGWKDISSDLIYRFPINSRRIIAIAHPQEDWNVGDEFTTPETGDKIFRVSAVHKYDVEAADSRSRAGYTMFTKSYIKKIATTPSDRGINHTREEAANENEAAFVRRVLDLYRKTGGNVTVTPSAGAAASQQGEVERWGIDEIGVLVNQFNNKEISKSKLAEIINSKIK